jgi:3-(3-hydroxy-phenyl)propionate hydroxylase
VATLDGRVRPLDDVLGPGFAVLGLGADPREGLPPGIVAAWERLDPRWLTVRPVEEPLSHEGEIADVDQTLVPLMRRYGATHVAVRPDRYVFDAGRHMIAPPWPQPQRQPERGQAATDRPPSLVT